MPDISEAILGQHLTPLQVCLNSGRPYVQGTQMLARAADWLAQVGETQDVTFTACAFRAITDKGVAIGPAHPTAEQSDALIGTASFSVADDPLEIGFYETDMPAPTDNIDEPCAYELIEGSSKDTVQIFEIAEMHGFEGLLVAMVQCLKTVHTELAADVHDIWFTGLRGAAIPCGSAYADARLTLTRARMMGKSPNWQSLTKMEVAGLSERPSLMSFAFKSNDFSFALQDS